MLERLRQMPYQSTILVLVVTQDYLLVERLVSRLKLMSMITLILLLLDRTLIVMQIIILFLIEFLLAQEGMISKLIELELHS